jgi:hypothetical protein
MLEFIVGEHHYRARKMNAFQQFHVARRLAPVISEVLTMGDLLAKAGVVAPPADGEEPPAPDLGKLIVPFADALSKVSDGDCNYVLGACLSMVQRQQGGNGQGPATWADIWSERAKAMMFEDINAMPPMMEIVMHVLQDNLLGFFGAAPPGPVAALSALRPPQRSVM